MNKRLLKIYGRALANNAYRRGINDIEQSRNLNGTGDAKSYALALLYDHLAMKHTVRKDLKSKYLKTAENIYRSIVKRNPKYLHGFLGIGRVYAARGQYKGALRYQIKAYRLMLRLPRSQHGALGIGATYEAMGKEVNAERWYKRELHSVPHNDFGATINLFQFYKRTGRRKEVAKLGAKLRTVIKAEYKKQIYKGLSMHKSRFLKAVKRSIRARVITESAGS